MMQCQICGDTNGPFELFDFKNRVVLGCEHCAKLSKENKIRQEKINKRKPKDKRKKYYYRTL